MNKSEIIEYSKNWLLSKQILINDNTICWGNYYNDRWQPGVLTTSIVLIALKDLSETPLYQKGVNYLVQKQSQFTGGWSTRNISKGDTNTTALCLEALFSHRNDGIVKKCIKKGLKFILNCQTEVGGFKLTLDSDISIIASARSLSIIYDSIQSDIDNSDKDLEDAFLRGIEWLKNKIQTGYYKEHSTENALINAICGNLIIKVRNSIKHKKLDQFISQEIDQIFKNNNVGLLAEETNYYTEVINREKKDIFYQRWWVVLPHLVKYYRDSDELSIYEDSIQYYMHNILESRWQDKENNFVAWNENLKTDNEINLNIWITASIRCALIEYRDNIPKLNDIDILLNKNLELKSFIKEYIDTQKINALGIDIISKVIDVISISGRPLFIKRFFMSKNICSIIIFLFSLALSTGILLNVFTTFYYEEFNFKMTQTAKIILTIISCFNVTLLFILEAWVHSRGRAYMLSALFGGIITIIVALLALL